MASELDRRTRIEAGEWLSAALLERSKAWRAVGVYRHHEGEAHEHGRALRWDSRDSLLCSAQRFWDAFPGYSGTAKLIARRWYHVLAAIYEYAASNAEE